MQFGVFLKQLISARLVRGGEIDNAGNAEYRAPECPLADIRQTKEEPMKARFFLLGSDDVVGLVGHPSLS